jgi:2'-5' RNA ligase
MVGLTHKTALVVIPPAEIWPPIQAIRKKHDRKIRRWMPHITLVYPFLPREQLGTARRFLADACGETSAFEIQLAAFNTFRHRRDNYTVWLRPEPEEPLVKLQAALCQATQEAGGSGTSKPFQPHLSVGQVTGRAKMVALVAQLQAAWSPLRIRISSVAMIWRNEPPDDVFRVAAEIPLIE